MEFIDRKHFFRYQKDDWKIDVECQEGGYFAWQKFNKNRQPSPRRDDVVWVLSGAGKVSVSYKFLYYFIVDSDPELIGDKWRIHGVKGEIFTENNPLNESKWFGSFFKKMGNGGTGIQPIPAVWLQEIIKWQRPKIDHR